MPFDGETYDHGLDRKRLTAQLYEVFRATIDGQWRTLEQIARIVAAEKGVHVRLVPTQSVSARLRDFRKPKFWRKLGNTLVVERRRSALGSGLYEYRVLKGVPQEEVQS